MNEREAARQRLERAVNMLGNEASLKVQMQRDPVKVIGGATGVGLVLGALVGSQLRRTRKIYVDAYSTPQQQKAFAKAQARTQGQGSVGNKLIGLAITLGFKYLQDQVITPRLEAAAHSLEQKSSAPSRTETLRPARVQAREEVELEVVPDPRPSGSIGAIEPALRPEGSVVAGTLNPDERR